MTPSIPNTRVSWVVIRYKAVNPVAGVADSGFAFGSFWNVLSWSSAFLFHFGPVVVEGRQHSGGRVQWVSTQAPWKPWVAGGSQAHGCGPVSRGELFQASWRRTLRHDPHGPLATPAPGLRRVRTPTASAPRTALEQGHQLPCPRAWTPSTWRSSAGVGTTRAAAAQAPGCSRTSGVCRGCCGVTGRSVPPESLEPTLRHVTAMSGAWASPDQSRPGTAVRTWLRADGRGPGRVGTGLFVGEWQEPPECQGCREPQALLSPGPPRAQPF